MAGIGCRLSQMDSATRRHGSVQARIKPDPGNQEIARIGKFIRALCRLHASPADGTGLMDCYPDDACREAIAPNVAADRGVSSICEVGEAKETGNEEREIGWFGSRSLDVRR